ncbi:MULTISPECIES: hypothetical protein [Methylocystis]|nr:MULTISPECIES: hypothetical protein [Methylocystis]MDJ0448005.1 hypothetical protein [Methylocystis sp. JR02]
MRPRRARAGGRVYEDLTNPPSRAIESCADLSNKAIPAPFTHLGAAA